MYKVVHKPWGKEEWLELNDAYCYKRIYINAGYKTSFQYHQFKKETNYIIDGIAEVWLENDEGIIEKKIMRGGEFFNVVPPKKHRVIAITDIILQEVSTPQVDDVFRIDDEFNRVDGKIEAEHKTPAVLLLAAGTGSRLGNLTKNINKAMLPINNKAIISHIIDKFPKEYEFVVCLGYKGKELQEYCKLAHPEHKFIFVNIDKFEGSNTGPGYSSLLCKDHLQRPFYLTVADCIIDSKMPHLDGNWLGVYPTAYPEKYSTVNIDKNDNILDFVNKSNEGYENAFIGLASIWDYEIFWKQLECNIKNGEIVSAFEDISKYSNFKVKHLKWLDTGNLDDLNNTKRYFKDSPLSLYKITDEITYNSGKFIKFNPNNQFIKNKSERAEFLKKVIPSNYQSTEYFISYDWEPGNTMYEEDSILVYTEFLKVLKDRIFSSNQYKDNLGLIYKFYTEKTENRKQQFINRFGSQYFTESYIINGKQYNSLENLMSSLDFNSFKNNPLYELFHGDLQFDNIIYNKDSKNKFIYIDWRESFADCTKYGDVYYDLAKLYGGSIIPYNMMKKQDAVNLSEGSTIINYFYEISNNLKEFRKIYETWIINNGFDLNRVKLITSIIFLNMSPLHDDKFAKMLWFKSIELLNDYR